MYRCHCIRLSPDLCPSHSKCITLLFIRYGIIFVFDITYEYSFFYSYQSTPLSYHSYVQHSRLQPLSYTITPLTPTHPCLDMSDMAYYSKQVWNLFVVVVVVVGCGSFTGTKVPARTIVQPWGSPPRLIVGVPHPQIRVLFCLWLPDIL